MRGPHDQAAMLGLQLDVFRQLRVFEQTLGHAYATRIAYADDAGFRNHVPTL